MSTSLQAIDPEAFKSYMREPAHTPGPWALSDEPDPLVFGPTGSYIAQVLAYDRDDRGFRTLRSNYADDAALIVAAPDLLVALQEIATHTRRSAMNPGEIVPTAAAVIARAAIAKATAKET